MYKLNQEFLSKKGGYYIFFLSTLIIGISYVMQCSFYNEYVIYNTYSSLRAFKITFF